MSPLLGDILKVAIPLTHSLVDETTIVLREGVGAEFDPEDLDATGGLMTENSVPCEAPWPYQAEGVDVAAGLMRTSFNGQAAELTLVPSQGMSAAIDGRRYVIVNATHDLAGDEWIVTLKGAG